MKQKIYLLLRAGIVQSVYRDRKKAVKEKDLLIRYELLDLHKDPVWDCRKAKCSCKSLISKYYKIETWDVL